MRNSRVFLLVAVLPVMLLAGTSWTGVDFNNPERFVQGEIAIRFAPEVDLDQVISETGMVEVSRVIPLNILHLKLPEGTEIYDAIETFEAKPDVLYAEPVTILHIYLTPNDPLFGDQWHFDADHINMPDAWDIETGDPGVVVGIIDSGVAYEDYAIPAHEVGDVLSGDGNYHIAPDFTASQFVAGYDFIENDNHPNDQNGHGTHVAGTVAQATDNSTGVAGVAFDCNLMPVRITDRVGFSSDVLIANGLTWAADNGADVVNISVGGPTGSSTMQDAVTYAYDAGVVIVCSAGNSGSGSVGYPAAYEECISVAACDYNDALSYYSSYGPGLDISAPGGDIYADENSDGYADGVLQCTYNLTNDEAYGGSQLATVDEFAYHFFQGTSMSSPHVAGLAALLRSQGTEDVDSIKTAIYETARDLGAVGYDQTYGYGMIDPVAALEYYTSAVPVADFTGTPTSGPSPLTVSFTDQSTGDPTEWDWDFGDSFTSTDQNPVHTYNNDGTYDVSLTARNVDGEDTETKVGYIQVGGAVAPTAAFSGTPTSGNAPLDVTFTDESTGDPTSWSWDFGDGNTSTTQNPVHTYNNDGTYTVSLTATNAQGSDTHTENNYITVGSGPQPPTAAFSGTPTSGNAPLAVTFTDESTGTPTSWSWDFGDGNTSTAQNPANTYTADGTYTVSLTATNAQGSDTHTENNYITVGGAAQAPTAAFTADPMVGYVPYSSRMEVTFTDASTDTPTSWSWDFGDGGTSTDQNPTHVFTSLGDFTVTLTATNSLGFDDTTMTIRLVSAPSDFTITATSMVDLNWNRVTVSYTVPVATKVEISVYSTNGRLIRRLLSEDVSVGEYDVSWDLRDENGTPVTPGVYFFALRVRDGHAASRIVITR